jgi:nucleotide-binding universal stress UspA family protein
MPSERSTIVVGVDGSEGSQRALRFALDEARLRNASLKLVAAWNIPVAVYAGPAVIPFSPEEFADSARAALEQALETLGDRGDVPVETLVKEGHPADILIATAGADDLLVVGSRGLGGFRGLLLGSVSMQCAQHAKCPVAIVPHRD